MRTQLLTCTAGLLLAATALAGCSDGGGSAAKTPETGTASSPAAGSSSDAATGTVVKVTFDGDTVTPSGERVEATVGQPVTLKISADRAGEIHVHSSPEQEISYPAGESTEQLTIDKPGLVEVESHTLEKVIVQLEVRP